jgi:hypothetical protein
MQQTEPEQQFRFLAPEDFGKDDMAPSPEEREEQALLGNQLRPQQEEDQSPDGIIGNALSTFARITRPMLAVPGYVSAEVAARKDILQEDGFKDIFTGEVGRRRREILEVDEQAGIRDQLRASMRYQEERESVFWGEKFITEMAFDPLNAFFFLKPLSIARSAAKAFGKAPVSKLAKDAASKNPGRLLNAPTDEALLAEGYADNKMRRLTQRYFRSPFGKIPIIRQLVQNLNPSGVRDAVAARRVQSKLARGEEPDINDIKEYIAVEHTNYMRLGEYMDSLVSGVMAPMRATTYHVLRKRLIHKEGDVWIRVTEKSSGKVVEKPLGDVIQFRSRYDFTNDTELLKLFERGDRLLDEAFAMMKEAGVPIKELAINTVEGSGLDHYWPRFVQAIRQVEKSVSPTGGKKIGGKPGFTYTRLHEYQEEALKNGVKYFGTGAKDPFSEVLETYLRGAMKSVADQRLANKLKPLGTTIGERMGKEAFRQVKITGKMVKKGSIAAYMLKQIIDPSKEAPTYAIRQIESFNPTIARDIRRAQLLPNPTDELIRIQKRLDNMLDDARDELRQARNVTQDLHRSATSNFGMSSVRQPGLTGQLFTNEVAGIITKQIGIEDSNIMLKSASNVGSLVRAGSLTLDWGFPMLQGAMVLTNAPITWVKASFQSLKALAVPRTRWNYLAKADTQEVLRTFGGRLQIGSNEFLEALQPGTLGRRSGSIQRIAELAGKPLPVVKVGLGRLPSWTVDQTFGRFGTSFEIFFDVSRIEMAKGLMPAIRSGQVGVAEAASHINKMTGIISSRALGVGASQREMESAMIFLAPRWTRAVTGMAGMALQGGWSGDQAFLALSKFFAGTTLLYSGFAKLLGQKIKLDPRSQADGGDGGKFMTVEIGGSTVGLGGKPLSMARLLLRMRSDPENAIEYLERWYRGQGAPATSIGWDIISGETYMGEPLRSPEGTWDIWEILKQEGSRLAPFWAQAEMDDPRPTWPGRIGEFAGLRSWPLQPSEKLEDFRDELAAQIPRERLMPDQIREMQRLGLEELTYDLATPNQKSQINNGRTNIEGIDSRKEELEVLATTVKERAQRRGESHISEFFDSIDDNVSDLEEAGRGAQRAVIRGEGSPEQFLAYMRPLVGQYAAINRNIYDKDGDNARAIKELSERRERSLRGGRFVTDAEQARNDYIRDIIGADDLVDALGEYNFDEAERRKNKLRRKWGAEVIRDVEESFKNNKDMPSLYRNWISDRDELELYWTVRESYIRKTPGIRSLIRQLERAEASVDANKIIQLGKHPAIQRMNSLVSQQRLRIRREDPMVDALLFFWGRTRSLQTREAYTILQRLRSQRLRGQGQAT